MSKEDKMIRQYHEALADILCWIDGYGAAMQPGDPFVRLNIQGLRELKSDLYGRLYGKAPEWLTTKQG